MDREARLTDYLRRWGTRGWQTLLAGVEEFADGMSWMLVDGAGRMEVDQYCGPATAVGPERRADHEAVLAGSAITDAVADRLEADVELGCFLSGGIDSSIVAAVAQQQLKIRGQTPLKTFCAKMPALDYDESRGGGGQARHIGEARHEELVIAGDPGRDLDCRSGNR